jgi:Na+/melibiose symporter-like transporter
MFATKVIYSLPQFTSNVLNGFIGNRLTMFYIQDLCNNNNNSKQCLSTRRFGTLSSIIGSMGLFVDLFISSFVDSQTNSNSLLLIAITCIIHTIVNITLFNVQYLQVITESLSGLPPMFVLSLLFTLLSVIKNVTPLGVAYNALGPALTKECSQTERNSLFAYKHMSSLLGNMVGGFLPSAVIYLLGEDTNIQWLSNYVTILSIIVLLSYLFMCFYLRNNSNIRSSTQQSKTTTDKESTTYTMVPNLKQAFQNRAFTALLLLFVYEAIRGILWGGLYPFYLSQVLGLDSAQYDFWGGVFNMTGMILAMIATPIWQHITTRLGNYRTWLLAYVIQVPVGIFVFLSIDIGQQQVYRYLFFFILLCITGSASGFLLDSIKANAIDYEELRTKSRREASFEACWGLFPRYISLFSNAFSFAIVSMYNTPELEKVGQYSYEAKLAISALAALMPSITSIGCLLLMYRFPVDDQKHTEVLEAIKKSRRGESAVDPVTQEIIKPVDVTATAISQSDLNCIRHFFGFELRWAVAGKLALGGNNLYTKVQTVIEVILFIMWNIVSILCGYQFIRGIVSESDESDMSATLNLWLSSVSFTIAYGFHYARMRMSIQLRNNISAQTIRSYLKSGKKQE